MSESPSPSPFLASVEPTLRFDADRHVACGDVFIAREMAPTGQAIEAMRHGAALPDRADRGWARVSGVGALAVLEAAGIADPASLAHGRGVLFERFVADRPVTGMVFADPGHFYLDAPRGCMADLLEHITVDVAEPVDAVDLSAEVGRIAVAGPHSPRLLDALGLADARQMHPGGHRTIEVIGEPVRICRTDFVPPMAFDLVIPGEVFNSVLAVICSWGVRLEMNLLPAGRDAVERLAREAA